MSQLVLCSRCKERPIAVPSDTEEARLIAETLVVCEPCATILRLRELVYLGMRACASRFPGERLAPSRTDAMAAFHRQVERDRKVLA